MSGAAEAGESGSAGSAEVRRERLANGMVVVVRPVSVAPVVAITLLVAVGSGHETPGTNGVTALLGRVLLKGTHARSALEIAQTAEDAGGEIESATDQEYSEVRARGLAAHWRTLLGLVHEVVTTPRLLPEEVEREREVLLAQIKGLEDQPFQVASRVLSRSLYGSHPYALPSSGEAPGVAGLAREHLVRHRETFYTPGRMVLSVCGDVPPADVLSEARERFGLLAPGPTAPDPPALPERPARPRDGEARPTEQAQLLVGFLAPPVGHADHVPLRVANTILGGGMSSRLFRALRDEAGLAYAVGSLYPTRRQGGRVVVYIGTAPTNLMAAESGIRAELGRLAAQPPAEAELTLAQASLDGAFALDLRTAARQSFYLAFYETMGVGAGYVSRYPRLIGSVTGADVVRVASRYLTEPSVVVVGPTPT